MKNKFSQWFLALTLVAYPIATVVLVMLLALHPVGGGIDSDELTSNTLLPDFSAIEQTPERKQLFLDTLRPLVEQKNALLLSSRERLLEIKKEYAENKTLGFLSTEQLARFRDDFNVTKEDYPSDNKAIDVLLLRVDTIPAAMVLAQAAIESGWGTSRFAEEANNLFGEWCYTKGCGLVPSRRAASAKHEVRKFDNIEEALNAYYHNINTHNAYRQLRDLRAKLRTNEQAYTGSALVTGLGKYSGRGPVYIAELRNVINANDLE